MRLLSTHSHKLSEFFGKGIPRYAILSHRWEDEEVTFQDIELTVAGRERKKGWDKLQSCRAQALKDGFDWIWDDTCCIDKSSSAELSEAINSMFDWYRGAEICYAYLFDVSNGTEQQFRESKWFSRGWTLQELLAPKRLVFFDRHWVVIGTREGLEAVISQITGIGDIKNFDRASVAQKMSWASARETTRIEDMAYSLLGLFKVNMPPLYGEGERAFIRLQREILAISDDESIFAWRDEGDFTGSLLARSPAAFQQSKDIIRETWDYNKPYFLMTNKGLRVESPLLPAILGTVSEADDTFIMPLQCAKLQGNQIPALIVRRVIRNTFARVAPYEMVFMDQQERGRLQIEMDSRPQTRHIVHVKQISDSPPFPTTTVLNISAKEMDDLGYSLSGNYCSNKAPVRWKVAEDVRQEEGVIIYNQDPGGMIVVFEYTRVHPKGQKKLFVVITLHMHRPRLLVYVANEDFSIDQRRSAWHLHGNWRTIWGECNSNMDGKTITFSLKREGSRDISQTYRVKIEMEEPEASSSREHRTSKKKGREERKSKR